MVYCCTVHWPLAIVLACICAYMLYCRLSVSVDKVLTRDRERAKRVVYAIVYGVGKEKLAEILDMNSTAAKELMTSFLSTHTHTHTHT